MLSCPGPATAAAAGIFWDFFTPLDDRRLPDTASAAGPVFSDGKEASISSPSGAASTLASPSTSAPALSMDRARTMTGSCGSSRSAPSTSKASASTGPTAAPRTWYAKSCAATCKSRSMSARAWARNGARGGPHSTRTSRVRAATAVLNSS